MPVGHFHRGAFSIHYVYYAAAAKYTCQCLKKPKEEVKTEQKMSGHAIFDHICKNLFFCRKKNNRQERFFVSKSEMLYFRDRSIKNPIILVEFDDQYQCCCSEASVVISIVSWEVKKRLDHIMVSWELGLRTDFFPAGPAGTLWWTLRENGLLEFLRTLATHNAARVQLESQSMRWFFYANRHQSVAFQPLRLLYYLTKNQSSKYFEIIV